MDTPEFSKHPVVLVVDDTPDNLSLMSEMLKDKYKVKLANNGEKALKIAASPNPPDIILLDIMMPVMDGYEVMKRLRAEPSTNDIPVIFLTAKSEIDDERYGLELGAVDYITKPVSPPIVLARLKTHLTLKLARDFLKDNNEYLQAEVKRRTEAIAAVQDVTIMSLSSLAETRDNDTGNHISRTQMYVTALARYLKDHPRFSSSLTEENIQFINKSAPLHDIGKVGIPDSILLKPGKLTDEEYEVMKKHASLGRGAIERAEVKLGIEVDFLKFAKEIAYYHHEKWDGTGYPEGVSADDIPVCARLMAVADVYDALISKRVYKTGMSHEKAREIITNGKNTQFDPDVVEAFLAIEEEFKAIADKFNDSEEHGH